VSATPPPTHPAAHIPAAGNEPARRRSWSFEIGRVAGINIRVHLTWFLLVPLFALAGAAPGGPGELNALLWLVIIFGCVVVHELAHCLVGRPRGLVVHEIELLPIGGVSKLENLPRDPRDEFAMAIAGPASSAGIAVLAGALAVALAVPLLPVDLMSGPLLARLFWFNLIIAAFNLLPAFPLDGGRVFRSLLERRYDLERSTRMAARAGRAVAITMIAVGLFWDLWLTIIGFFVYFGASAEEAATIVHVRLRGRRVGDVMLLDPVVVDAAVGVDQLRDLLRRSAQRVFPVVVSGTYEGLLDEARIDRGEPGADARELADHSTAALIPTDDLEESLEYLLTAPTHAMAVADDGRVIGLLRAEDVEHLLAALTRRNTQENRSRR
jgi:Zn-dependent protease